MPHCDINKPNPQATYHRSRRLPKGRPVGVLWMRKHPPDSLASLMSRVAHMQRTVLLPGGFNKRCGKWAGASWSNVG